MHRTFNLVVTAACLCLSLPAGAQEASLPLWEAGVGAFGARTPAYPGAAEHTSRALALPFLLYRGEVLRADQGGIGARLFRSDRLEFDVGLAGALPSDSDAVSDRPPAALHEVEKPILRIDDDRAGRFV